MEGTININIKNDSQGFKGLFFMELLTVKALGLIVFWFVGHGIRGRPAFVAVQGVIQRGGHARTPTKEISGVFHPKTWTALDFLRNFLEDGKVKLADMGSRHGEQTWGLGREGLLFHQKGS